MVVKWQVIDRIKSKPQETFDGFKYARNLSFTPLLNRSRTPVLVLNFGFGLVLDVSKFCGSVENNLKLSLVQLGTSKLYIESNCLDNFH